MAFSKFANARVIKPDIHMSVWDDVLSHSQALGSAFSSREASKITLAEYNPKEYMLSHNTIVASVDVEKGPGPLGRHLENGFVVDRQYEDYLVSPKTAKLINNNHDCWERKLLLSSFRTFIGGENYVEHLQIPEMSKGKIIDAAARDVGDSIYIDILVATHRKHRPLIAAVQSGKLQTLSMGANVAFTLCTKCGNVAADETQLCRHVKYEKGNQFLGPLGQNYKVAELCGHILAEPGSNKFIEASWVANPAFTGAVLRSILSPEEASVYNRIHNGRVQVALSQPTRVADPSLRSKAARKAFDFGDEQEQFPGSGGDEDKKEENPLEKAVDDLAEYLKGKAVTKVREDMKGQNGPGYEVTEDHPNDTIIKEAGRHSQWRRIASAVDRWTKDPERTHRIVHGLLLYKAGGWRAVQASNKFSGRDVLAISRVLDLLQGTPRVAGEARIYRTVLAVGGAEPYSDAETYLAACRRVLGRDLTQTERDALMTKGRLFDLGR